MKFLSKAVVLPDHHRLKQMYALHSLTGRRNFFPFYENAREYIIEMREYIDANNFGTLKYKNDLKNGFAKFLTNKFKMGDKGRKYKAVAHIWDSKYRSFALGRKQEILLHQLRIGWSDLNDSKPRNKPESRKCSVCGVIETRDHYLCHCREFKDIRSYMHRKLIDLGFQPPFTAEFLLDFESIPLKIRPDFIQIVCDFVSHSNRFPQCSVW